MGFGVGKGRGQVERFRTQTLPPPRMTVMSLVVLVLSWGSLGLEAATAVVSQRPGSRIQGQVGARVTGSEVKELVF